ncbi:transposase [Rhizobium leguminosarum]|uniref:transposase n=1 Tax=Rhizobium leguminosarum TaxID=384 RepID=UPI001FF0528C|nr:transposase [Rhizobium leguminosarum]
MSEQHDRSSEPGDAVPHILRQWLSPFRFWFTAPSWEHLLVLVMGALLSPGKRTVTACLRITGRAEASNFAAYHQLLNRSPLEPPPLAARLLSIIVARFVPVGPVVIGMDDTIERRWGQRIAARGIYRDPVRSSHGHFVKRPVPTFIKQRDIAPGGCPPSTMAPCPLVRGPGFLFGGGLNRSTAKGGQRRRSQAIHFVDKIVKAILPVLVTWHG